LAYQELFRAELSRIELEQIRTTVNQAGPGSESASVEDRRIQQRTNQPEPTPRRSRR